MESEKHLSSTSWWVNMVFSIPVILILWSKWEWEYLIPHRYFLFHLGKNSLRFLNNFYLTFPKMVVNKQKVYFPNSISTIIEKFSILSSLAIKYMYLDPVTPNSWKYHTVYVNNFEISSEKYKQRNHESEWV